ncbi:MAG: DNA translocase FtsK [Lactovum sp.]
MARTSKTKKLQAKKAGTRKSMSRDKIIYRKAIFYFISIILLFFATTRLGYFGVLLYNLTELFVGTTAYLALALYFVYLTLNIFRRDIFQENTRLIPALIIIYVALLLIIQMIFAQSYKNDEAFWNVLYNLRQATNERPTGGGFIGWALYTPSVTLFSEIGVYVISAFLIILGCFMIYPKIISKAHDYHQEKQERNREFNEEKRELKAQQRAEKKQVKKEEKLRKKEEKLRRMEQGEDYNFQEQLEDERDYSKENPFVQVYSSEQENFTPNSSNYNNIPIIGDFNRFEEIDEVNVDENLEEIELQDEFIQHFSFAKLPSQIKEEKELKNYQLPNSTLLAKVPIQSQEKEKVQVRKNIKILEDTFKSFGISTTVESAIVGPSITKYEIKLATGVRVNRVANLADDLALALAAKDVRIEVPIPGKSLVGVEIPNKERTTVGFREMWEAAKTDPNNPLEIPLGKSLDGTIKIFDLAKMPHLLVAGSTGSGKSVAVNGIIASILMKASPNRVKFLMIDPKMVELSVYNDIPQLLIPVVTNPRKASRALQKVVDEMERRYELFSRQSVRNITGYNEKLEKFNAQSDEKEILLPLIVVIVDELADLMMVASKEVEDAIIRLGQKARAAGIHMILATQRPSVDVISGLIKANVPSRVAFAVSSGTDSRTILDTNGAEKLLGRGDMLFKPIDENHPVRLQGSFLSDEDVERLVDYIKEQTSPNYDDSFDPGEAAEDDNRSGYAGAEKSSDPLFEEAKAMIISAQKASTSQLQRTLKVGFNRAADLMNELEADGVVGPAKGTTPRKVLIKLDTEVVEEENDSI